MSFNLGGFSKYDDANSIADPMVAVAAKAIQLGHYKSKFFQSMLSPLAGFLPNTVDFEIYNRTKSSRAGTITEAVASTSATEITVDAVNVKGLTVGHIIEIGSENLWISAVNRATSVATVSRGFGGTTATTHADDSAWAIVGYAGNDSNLKDVESYYENTGVYTNYYQTIFETIDWEAQANIFRRKGLNDVQISKILLEESVLRVAEELGYMALHGKKQAGNGSLPYASAGLFAQLADNASGYRPTLNFAGSGALTEVKLRSALKLVSQTGSPDTIWVSQSQKEVINGFNSSIIQTGREDKTAGSYIDTYNYDGLMLSVKVDSDMTDDKIAIVTQSMCQMAWCPGDGLRVEDEPKASSREHRQSVQGTLGFIVEGVGYNHITIDGLTV